MKILDFVKSKFPVDPETVAAYQTVLPHRVHVSIDKDGEFFIATIDEFGDKEVKGLLVTEAKDMHTLVQNVNDLVYTKVNMPLNIRPYYGNVFTPDEYRETAKSMNLVKA